MRLTLYLEIQSFSKISVQLRCLYTRVSSNYTEVECLIRQGRFSVFSHKNPCSCLLNILTRASAPSKPNMFKVSLHPTRNITSATRKLLQADVLSWAELYTAHKRKVLTSADQCAKSMMVLMLGTRVAQLLMKATVFTYKVSSWVITPQLPTYQFTFHKVLQLVEMHQSL